ncbi:hypothetical protein IVB44_00055 [Bradyrhizobium sp. 49]|uniref:transposase n=1 Tax=unclassified Bradyrhizobium TaxID=2631580 RepID=UPI001FFA4908|nr:MULTISPECIES: transposase [unclassified Bradyrhizobium]MCK1268910.1 hypothetical protein [Bradyrhizobium sp. 84]MCK1369470.1 hypothetical protein [Bradyrhizobium sp. 49]
MLNPPPCSPDFNLIEKALSKVKAALRTAAQPIVNGLWDLIGRSSMPFNPAEYANCANACGYLTD